jgi:hypothetical protein
MVEDIRSGPSHLLDDGDADDIRKEQFPYKVC